MTSVREYLEEKSIDKHTDSLPPAIAVACQEDDVRSLNGLIVGPPDTPYEFGFFEVGSPPYIPDHVSS